jgi:hypothetical protein
MSVSRGSRRGFLAGAVAGGLSLAASSVGCAPATGGNPITPSEVYVGLGRRREVAILDAVTDRVLNRISLAGLGERGAPGQIAVGPTGNAAVVPLVSTSAAVGLIQQQAPSRLVQRLAASLTRRDTAAIAAPPDDPAAEPAATGSQCSWIRLGEDAKSRRFYMPTSAQQMASDAQGTSYIVVADSGAARPPQVAIVDLRSGELLRKLPVAQAGESVLALLPHPSAERLFVAIWNWGERRHGGRFGDGASGAGRLVALDARTGDELARAALPEDAAVTDLNLAASAPGTPDAGNPAAPMLYAAMTTPGPAILDEVDYSGVDRRHSLLALDPDSLDVHSLWSLGRQPAALAMLPNGARAYLLGSATSGSPWGRALACLDLTVGRTTHTWPLPDGCFALTLSPVGKLYVADALGDRLWRFDVRHNTMLGDLPLPGAPLTLATRPV